MDVRALKLTPVGGAVRFAVHAKPRARKSAIVGVHGDAIDVAIGAPPVDGAANAELTRFLAKTLGVARSAVEVVRGDSSRDKLVEVRGVTLDDVRARLADASARR